MAFGGSWGAVCIFLALSELYLTDVQSVSKIGFIQGPLWNNAKMNALRDIKGLDEYFERWDVS